MANLFSACIIAPFYALTDIAYVISFTLDLAARLSSFIIADCPVSCKLNVRAQSLLSFPILQSIDVMSTFQDSPDATLSIDQSRSFVCFGAFNLEKLEVASVLID
jgi:hypothetical protein